MMIYRLLRPPLWNALRQTTYKSIEPVKSWKLRTLTTSAPSLAVANVDISKNVKPVTPRWFYATDVPLTKPFDAKYKPTKRAAKFLPFTAADSKKLENAYMRLPENAATNRMSAKQLKETLVNVNEDGLFCVDLKTMTIKSTYWIGPTYEVRRGIWFGKENMPIPNLLSDQIEANYVKYRPDYFLSGEMKDREHQLPGIRITAEKDKFYKKYGTAWPYVDFSDLSDIGKILHFKSADKAILLNEGQLLSKSFLETVPGTSTIFAYDIKRGYDEEKNAKNERKNKQGRAQNLEGDNADAKINGLNEVAVEAIEESQSEGASLGFTSFLSETNKKFQLFMENDFSNDTLEINNSIDRDVDHLILCVHGIGQTLSSKHSSINFAHDCNHLRQSLKSEFVKKAETFVPLAYNGEKPNPKDERFKNCKVQVLPIIWRHDINFGLNYVNQEKSTDGMVRLPKLSDLNVDAMTPIRDLTADVLLDILLFYEPKYHKLMLETVTQSANQLYDQYVENHPNFKGKVSLIGHSLGSSIVLDILSRQPNVRPIGREFDPKRHLKFDVENFFAMGSPNGVFRFLRSENIHPRSAVNENSGVLKHTIYPKVNNLYNIFYATDLVAYRVEPLVHSSYATMKPVKVKSVPESNILTSSIKDISKASSDILANPVVKKLVETTAANLHLTSTKNEAEEEAGSKSVPPSENAEDGRQPSKVKTETHLSEHAQRLMRGLNGKNGRVDYVLPQGMFDIDVINAVNAHIQYLDDTAVADLLLQELWKTGNSSK